MNHTCDTCKDVIYDEEYFIMIKGEPNVTPCLLCSNHSVKNGYYNRNFKQTKVMINPDNEPPVIIGRAHDFCRGIYYNTCGESVLMSDDEDEE